MMKMGHLGRNKSPFMAEVILVNMFVKSFCDGVGMGIMKFGCTLPFTSFFSSMYITQGVSQFHTHEWGVLSPNLWTHLAVSPPHSPPAATSQSTVSILGPLSPGKEEKKRHISLWSNMPELVGGLQERAAHWLQLPYAMPKATPIPQRLDPKACPFGPSQDNYEGPFCFQSLISCVLQFGFPEKHNQWECLAWTMFINMPLGPRPVEKMEKTE